MFRFHAILKKIKILKQC